MTPESLFESHVGKAEDIARKLCWMYKISGALAFQDEALSEARIALWRCAMRFDPNKQALQRKRNLRQESDALWSIILDQSRPIYSPEDPFKNFWIASVRRVRGAVLDFFRSERLIIKRSLSEQLEHLSAQQIDHIKKRLWECDDEEEVAHEFGIDPLALRQLKPTMLYHERFMSMEKLIGDPQCRSSSGGGDTFGDMLPSPIRTDRDDERTDQRRTILAMTLQAGLTKEEHQAIALSFHEHGYTPHEVAGLMQIPPARVQVLVQQALTKLRASMLAKSA